MTDRAEMVICTYRPRPGKEEAFRVILARHWPVLREAELVTDRPPLLFRGEDGAQRPIYVEIFEWRSFEAKRLAHGTPAVLAEWEAMVPLCEERDGRPAMEFQHVQSVDVP